MSWSCAAPEQISRPIFQQDKQVCGFPERYFLLPRWAPHIAHCFASSARSYGIAEPASQAALSFHDPSETQLAVSQEIESLISRYLRFTL